MTASTPSPQLPVHVRAPGKINLYLGVGAPGEHGYHEIATAYQAVSLYDDVYAEPADTLEVIFTPSADGGPGPDRNHYALRAAKAIRRRTRFAGGARIRIDKGLPFAGGMGGGAADAAAVLVALDTLWGTGLGREQLVRLGARIGVDVPFALLGGTAIGTGRGDRLSPALATGSFHWVVVTTGEGLATADVYRELDAQRAEHADQLVPAPSVPEVPTEVLQALRGGSPHQLAEVLHNDLQVAVMRRRPDLTAIIERGERAGALAGVVCGSGPTVAFLTASADDALALQLELSAAGLRALRVGGAVHGARVVNS